MSLPAELSALQGVGSAKLFPDCPEPGVMAPRLRVAGFFVPNTTFTRCMERPDQLRIADFNYGLPEHKIAKYPLAERDRSKLLVWRAGKILDQHFADLPTLLEPHTCLVINNTRVIHARLKFKTYNGHTVEVFCLSPAQNTDPAQLFAATSGCRWNVLIGNNRKWKRGPLTIQKTEVSGQWVELSVQRLEKFGAELAVEFTWNPPERPFLEVIELFGSLPIPPYLNRESDEADEERYQTVYARHNGSVAAPTAGLHFTPRVFAALDARGIERHEVTLHVGAGTFRPVKVETMAGHEMHSERISIDVNTLDRLSRAKKIIPVGTTSMRTLESVYWAGLDCNVSGVTSNFFVDQWRPYAKGQHQGLPHYSEVFAALADALRKNGRTHFEGYTQLLIAPGYTFRVCHGLITNFHQPESTLLLLVAALVGTQWKEIYDHALQNDYRFLSYGDSSLLLP